jgi:hypothetical protein
MDKVGDVLDEVARWPLPEVFIGEPEYDQNCKLVNPAVDGLQLMQNLPNGFSRAEANEASVTGFLDELLYCLAARRGLVWVDRVVPTDELTPRVLADHLPPEDIAFLLLTAEDSSPFTRIYNSEQEVCLRLGSEDELTPEDLVFYRWDPGDETLDGILSFNRLVPQGELTLEQAEHLSHFMYMSEELGAERSFIKATDRVRFAVEAIQAIDGL